MLGKKGFTLVELLMVLGLMAVLIIFIIPSIISFVNERMVDVEDVENKLLLESISSYMDRNPNKYTKLDGSVYCIPVLDMIEFGSLEKVFIEKSEAYNENQKMLVSVSFGKVEVLDAFDEECIFPLFYGSIIWTSQLGTVTAEVPAANGTIVEYRVGQNDVWGAWQVERIFPGLNPAENYKFQSKADEVEIEDILFATSPKANQEIDSITNVSWSPQETTTTATVTPVTGATHYRVNSGSWQVSNVFPDLEFDVEYSFRARKETTATLNEVITPAFISTSVNEWLGCGNDFNDARDDNTYVTVQIGDQCWFADNLAYTTEACLNETWDDIAPHTACRKNEGTGWDQEEVKYQWGAVMNGASIEGSQGFCPDGWYIPTDADWKTLEMHLGMTQIQADGTGVRGTDQGQRLKSTDPSWSGTNTVGFNAKPAGRRFTSTGVLNNVGAVAIWWTSSPNTWGRYVVEANTGVYRYEYTQPDGLSVRCILEQ